MTDEATKNTSNIIAFDDDEIQVSTPDDEEDFNMLFMTNETVIFKDGKGINREVLYLGPISSNGVLKHKIWTHNDAKFLVDGILLSSLDTPDIATILFTPEQYAVDLSKLTEAELRQISTPQSLDDD